MIKSMTHKDLFSAHSADYRSFRPTYPQALFDHLATLVTMHDVAWDVGCGNGQSSVELAKHFGTVHATDISREQLKNAIQHPRVRYSIASAESSGLSPGSVNLTTSSQAFHWFHRENFIAELRRVSAPGAVVAIWCYDVCKISDELDPIIEHLYNGILKGYWESERALVDELYLRTLSREPTNAERTTALAYCNETKNRPAVFEDLLWALINTPEFLYKD